VIRRNSPREKLESLFVAQFRTCREEGNLKQNQITEMNAMLLPGIELREKRPVTSYPKSLPRTLLQ
jgi:hypothetical protein